MNSDSPFLFTHAPEHADRRTALAVFLTSAVVFLAAAPFAQLPLPQIPAFLPIYQSALVICEVITAVLLFGQYFILRSKALPLLACGYLFSAFMAVFHALSFPGLFAPAGLLGAGAQTTAWIYFFWHGGFPLFVLAYALLKNKPSASTTPNGRLFFIALPYVLAGFALAGGLTLLAVSEGSLPVLMAGNMDAPAKVGVAVTAWMFSLVALIALWWRRPHSVLDLWLMVVMCVWLFDSALAAVLNHGRYDLGWYVGRVYGLLAASFVLMVLLLDNGKLYIRLAASHERERDNAQNLRQLTAQLESVNDLLAQRNQQLQEMSQLKSEFLANMSHELRTPLNAIIGFSEVLKDGLAGDITPRQHEFVSDIFSSGQHLLSLINDILDLSKIEAGKMVLDLDAQDVNALLTSSFLVIKEKAAAHAISLRLDVTGPLGTMLLDTRKTKQIVFNLLSNGVKFTPDGASVSLRACKVPRAAIESWTTPQPTSLRHPLAPSAFTEFLEISVTDTGIGIAATDVPRLFQSFSQLDSSLSRVSEGTGLGLALVLKLAQLHGGTVALASTPGQGSTFTVWLPWRPTESVAGGPGEVPTSTSSPGVSPKLALVIEDNVRAADLIRLQLEPEGFEIVLAPSAKEGLAWLEKQEPAVILLDLVLPDMDGWDLLARLKQPDSSLAHIPVVIVSIVADARKGFFLGASAVLQKPVARDELIRSLQGLGLATTSRTLKVLVIDDDKKAVDLLSAYLAEPGYSVLRAYGGSEGIAVARRERPDLLVLDLLMPEVNGFDVVEALKGDPQTAAIPIIVVTAKTLMAEDRAALNGYVAAVLEKASFNHAHFINEVQRVLKTGRSAAA